MVGEEGGVVRQSWRTWRTRRASVRTCFVCLYKWKWVASTASRVVRSAHRREDTKEEEDGIIRTINLTDINLPKLLTQPTKSCYLLQTHTRVFIHHPHNLVLLPPPPTLSTLRTHKLLPPKHLRLQPYAQETFEPGFEGVRKGGREVDGEDVAEGEFAGRGGWGEEGGEGEEAGEDACCDRGFLLCGGCIAFSRL